MLRYKKTPPFLGAFFCHGRTVIKSLRKWSGHKRQKRVRLDYELKYIIRRSAP